MPSVSSVMSSNMNALVAGNGSYILRLNGHDLHGPTKDKVKNATLTVEMGMQSILFVTAVPSKRSMLVLQ